MKLERGIEAVGRGIAYTDVITLTPDAASGLDAVQAEFTMTPAYDITVTLSLADSSQGNCLMTLTLSGERKQQVTTVTGGKQMDSRITDIVEQMLRDASAYDLAVVSAYRPKEEQNTLYWRKVKQYTDKGYSDLEAQKVGGTIVKRPGFSEHNCGLAMDVGGSGDYTLEQTFANTAAYTWLMEHCADYGFILRFPEGKEDITGVIYEPWHYRYVGVEAARYIMDNDLCLEEYLEQYSS